MIDSIEVRCPTGTIYKGKLRTLILQTLFAGVKFAWPVSVYVDGELEEIIEPTEDPE